MKRVKWTTSCTLKRLPNSMCIYISLSQLLLHFQRIFGHHCSTFKYVSRPNSAATTAHTSTKSSLSHATILLQHHSTPRQVSPPSHPFMSSQLTAPRLPPPLPLHSRRLPLPPPQRPPDSLSDPLRPRLPLQPAPHDHNLLWAAPNPQRDLPDLHIKHLVPVMADPRRHLHLLRVCCRHAGGGA